MAGVVAAASRDPTPYFRRRPVLRGWTTEEMVGRLDSVDRAHGACARGHRVAIVPTLVVHEMLSRLDNPTLSRPAWRTSRPAPRAVRDVAGLLRRTGWRTRDLQGSGDRGAHQNSWSASSKRAGGLTRLGSDAANQLLVPASPCKKSLACSSPPA